MLEFLWWHKQGRLQLYWEAALLPLWVTGGGGALSETQTPGLRHHLEEHREWG